MLDTALSNKSSSLSSSNGSQTDTGPNWPDTIFILPNTISGWSTKYLFILIPSSLTSNDTQSGNISVIDSLFCKKIISEVTSVPALFLKVLFGSLIAPNKSALCAIYFLTSIPSLSIVPLLVTKAITPPGLTLSIVFAKK